jgi:glycosyltransferase involved in cell wall biosynthesis
MMRVLVCATEAPLPPVNGMRLQLRHLCAELARRHEVTVLAYRHADQYGAAPAGVELIAIPAPARSAAARAAVAVRATARRWPRGAIAAAGPLTRTASRLLDERRFDVVHISGPHLVSLSAVLGGVPAVLSVVDAWHLNAAAAVRTASWPARPLRRLDLRHALRFTARAYRPFRAVVMVSEDDARAVRALDPTLRLDVVPNGVDTDHFRPDPAVAREPGLIVLTGAMHWPPNVEAARFLASAVLPRVRKHRPDARLALVGRGPTAEVRRLGELEAVRVTGEVPDVRPWLRRAEAFACPMVSGTGIKNKLLEALACATPSVASPLALQGVSVVAGEDVLVADGAEPLAGEIVRLLDDPGLRDRIGPAGRRAVREHHSWAASAAAYEAIYQRAVSGG